MNPRLSRRAPRQIEHELARSDPYLKVLFLSFTGQKIRTRPPRLFARLVSLGRSKALDE